MTGLPPGPEEREPEEGAAAPPEGAAAPPEPSVPEGPWDEEEEACPETDVLGGTPFGWDAGEPLPPAPGRGAGAVLTGALVVLLSLGLVACAAWAVKLSREKAQVAAGFDRALGMIAEVAPAELGTQLAAVRTDLQAGNLTAADDKIATLTAQVKKAMAASGSGGGTGPEGGRLGPITEAEYRGLTPDAATFFRQHEDLFRRFLAMCDRAREMRDAGQNVEALRKARDQTLEAARLGQLETVQQRLMEFGRLLGSGGSRGGRGGPGGAPPGPLREKAAALQRAMQQAMRQGRDPRAAFGLARQAQQVAEGGDLKRAGELMDQAITAVKRAPRGRGDFPGGFGRGGRPGGRPGMGPGGFGGPGRAGRANPLGDLMQTVLRLMSLEEGDLAVVWDRLTAIQKALAGPEEDRQPDTLKPVLEVAMTKLQTVADRRKQFTMRLRGPRGPGQPGGGRMGPGAGMDRGQMFDILRGRVDPLLVRIRAMSDLDFLTDRDQLMRDLVQAVMRPPTPEELASAQPPSTPREQRRQQAERIRAKMLKASPELRKQEIEGQDMTEVENLFSQARKLLYGGDLGKAEEAADKALTMLGIPLAQFGPRPGPPPAGSELYSPDATRLRVGPARGRGRGRGRGQPAAPPSGPGGAGNH